MSVPNTSLNKRPEEMQAVFDNARHHLRTQKRSAAGMRLAPISHAGQRQRGPIAVTNSDISQIGNNEGNLEPLVSMRDAGTVKDLLYREQR